MKNVLSNEEISALFMELSLLLHAGVSTGDALALLAKEGVAEDLLTGMAAQVDDGAELSAALRKSGAFPVYACGLVEVGERTGRTEEALAALSRYYEDRVRLTRGVRCWWASACCWWRCCRFLTVCMPLWAGGSPASPGDC